MQTKNIYLIPCSKPANCIVELNVKQDYIIGEQ
jgi:hypothetical protein